MSLPTTFILAQEPTELWAGVSAAWTKSLSDFPASASWLLSYTLTPPTGAVIAIAWTTHVTASGDNFAIAIPGTLTAGIVAGGVGRLTGKVTKGTDTAIIYDSMLTWRVIGERSLAQRMVDLINTVMLGAGTRDENQISITTGAGTSKSLGLCSKLELQGFLNYWQTKLNAELAAENAVAGRGTGRRILNRYTTPQ